VTTTTLGAASRASCSGATTVTGTRQRAIRVAQVAGAEGGGLVGRIDGDDGAGLGQGLGLGGRRQQGEGNRKAGDAGHARRHAGTILRPPFRHVHAAPPESATMELDRRTFLILAGRRGPDRHGHRSDGRRAADGVGHVRRRTQARHQRIGQLNMTEHDPVALDVEAWADYWASLKVDVVLVSVTGILASTRPGCRSTARASTRHARFFGDCFAAARSAASR
jgi:hypothetical protein